MSFLIVGAGRVGLRTARIVAEEGYAVLLVERDPDRVAVAEDQGFEVVEGDGGDADVLEAAGVADADAIAGLTGDLNVNFAACLIGAEYGCRTVMRIDEDYREAIYEKYADQVDEIVYPEQLGAAGAKTALLGGNFNLLADLTEELQLLQVRLPAGSPAVGRRVVELEDLLELENTRIYAHGRAREPMAIPLPGTTIEPDDRIALIADRDVVETVRGKLLGDAASTAPSEA